MAIMIIAVTMFFALVGMIILATQVSSLNKKAAALQGENAQLLVSKIADSPEFSCGNSFGTALGSCIDEDKVMGLKSMISKYGNGKFWGVQGIEILEISPGNSQTECTQDNYPDCGKINIVKSQNGTGVPNYVSLCRRDYSGGVPYGNCSLAEVIVTYNG